jgi:hypothetical protein
MALRYKNLANQLQRGIGPRKGPSVGISALALKILRHMAQNSFLFHALQLSITPYNAILYMNRHYWP